jgi:hypothetical protein
MNTIIQSVASRVKVCTLKTGAWRANKLNRKETAELCARHGVAQGTAKVPVHVCDHRSLGELTKLHGEAYAYHVGVTHASVDDAIRLLPMCREMEHAAKMADFRRGHDSIVATFLADYPQERAAAPIRLNGLYDAAAWPSLESIASKFRFETSYRPCPTDGAWEDWLNVSVQAAQLELTERLEEAIKRVAERCACDGKLYQSVFANLGELLALVPDLNLTNDLRIAAIAAQAAKLAGESKESCACPSRRKDVAAKAQSILSMFGRQ